MSNLENMRIVCDDIMPWGHLKLYDNDGKELPLHGVQDIEVTIPVGGPVRATVQMLTEIDVRADVAIDRLRLNTETGEYERIDQDAIRAAITRFRDTALMWNRVQAGLEGPDASFADAFCAYDDAWRALFALLGLDGAPEGDAP